MLIHGSKHSSDKSFNPYPLLKLVMISAECASILWTEGVILAQGNFVMVYSYRSLHSVSSLLVSICLLAHTLVVLLRDACEYKSHQVYLPVVS